MTARSNTSSKKSTTGLLPRLEMPGWLMARDDALFDRLEAVEAAAAERGMTMAQYALRWVLEQPAVAGHPRPVRRLQQAGQLGC